MSNDVQDTGAVAHLIADQARKCIGPNGTVFQCAEEDAGMIRASFVARLGEAALRILDGEIGNTK